MINSKNVIFKKLISLILSTLLIFSSTTNLYAAKAVKSAGGAGGAGGKDKGGKSKNLDRVYGNAGTLNESKEALISVDALALQNYADSQKNYDFSTYKKVTLKTVILEAISQSNKVKSAKEKVVQTDLSLKDAYAAYLPLLDFQYSNKMTKNKKYTTDPEDNLNKKPHTTVYDENYGFRVRQTLYSGGSTALKIKSLQAKAEEGRRKYLIVIEQVIQDAIKAYFGVLFSYKNLKINEKNMEKLNKILEITQIKFDSGALSIGDLSAVKANIANSNSKLIKVKSSLADALDYYQYLLGENFIKTYPYQLKFVTKLDSLEKVHNEILKNNLSLLNYRLNIQSTKYKMLNIKASFKPKVDLELSYKNILNEENFIADKESYYAKVTMSYTIYNAGKDTRKILTSYSTLKELKYRYQEEIKKIKWSTQKLYNSATSLENTIKSTVEEVDASNEMINAYWEGFQLGEQDLQVLLQGQRQLNSAELDLLKYKQDYLTNIFKLEKEKGNLSNYFGINPDNPTFIDFTDTKFGDSIASLDLSKTKTQNTNTKNSIKEKDLDKTIDQYLEVVKEPTFEDVLNFKDSFLVSPDEDYTLVISNFNDNYSAYNYIKDNRLLQNAFSYEYFDKEGEYLAKKSISKVVSVKTNIAYGIFKSKEEALRAKDDIENNVNKKEFTAMLVKDIKNTYNRYVEGLETIVDPYLVKPKIVKTFVTNQEFKNEFLNAPEHYFSINVVSFSKIKSAVSLIKSENIEKESLVFKYGRNGEWIKVMYGIYPTYSQAFEALSQHPKMLQKYHPVIEKISQKQKLYKKYKKYNYLPKWYKDEQIRLEKERKHVKKTPQEIKEDIVKKALEVEKKLAIAKAQREEELKQEEELKKLQEEKILNEKAKKEEEIKKQKLQETKKLQEIAKEKLLKEQKAKEEAEKIALLKKQKEEALLKEKKILLEKERLRVQKEEQEKQQLQEAIKKEKRIQNQKKLEESLLKEQKDKQLQEAKRLKEEKLKAEQKAKEEANEKALKLENEKQAKLKKEEEMLKQRAIMLAEEKEAEIKAQKLKEQKAKQLQEAKRLKEEKLKAEQKVKDEANAKALKLEKEKQAKLKKENEAKKLALLKKQKEEEMLKQRAIMLAQEEKTKKKRTLQQEEMRKKIQIKEKERKLAQIKIKDKKNSSNFAIHLTTIKRSQEKNFIDRYILDSNYKIIHNGNMSKIIYGNYKSKVEAEDAIENLHPRIISKAKIISIQSDK